MEVADLYATLGLHPKESEWARGDALIGKMKVALVGLVGVEAMRFFGGLIEKTQEQAIESERLAMKLGITSQAVQQLSYAADVSGASVEQFQVAMQKLARGVDQFKTKGTGDAGSALARLGIGMDDAAFKSGNLDDQLMRIADGFADAGPNVNKTAIAMEIFGRSGTALIPFLNRGADGIRELRDEFVETGAQIDGPTTESFKAFEEDQKKLKYTLIGLRNEAVTALLPALKELAEGAMAWLRENKELVKSTLTTFVQGLTIALEGLGYAFEAIADVIDFFKEHTDLATALIIALGLVIAAFAVEAAISWIVAFWPLFLVIAIITLVVLAVLDIWRSITTGKGVAASVFRWIKTQLSELWEGIKSIGRGIADFFITVATGFKDAFLAAFDWIVEKAKAVAETLRNLPILKQFLDAKEFTEKKLGVENLNPLAAPGQLGKAAVAAAGGDTEGNTGAAVEIGASAFTPNGLPYEISKHAYNAIIGGEKGGIAKGAQAALAGANFTQTNKIEINGVTDPEAVGEIVDKKIKESKDKMMIDAHAAVGGDQPAQ